ncbi:MAG: DUF3039 domain-containing protein [Candidatus Ancillula sp.]|nr:DUF3039 domain-containing protein [Candidatus Ancillula sp.]
MVQTSVMETTVVENDVQLKDTDEAEKYAHWVDAKKSDEARLTGGMVVALCGKVWHPQHDGLNYPVCPKCNEIYKDLLNSGMIA